MFPVIRQGVRNEKEQIFAALACASARRRSSAFLLRE